MGNKNLSEKLASLGITAEAHKDGALKMTMKQYDKLLAIAPDAQFDGLLPKEGRVVVRVDETTIDAAIAANAKAPRTASSVAIVARTVYEIKCDGTNEVTYAEWASDSKTGFVVINGNEYSIFTGLASDYYEVGEESDPYRAVYVVKLPVGGGETVIPSYGVTNLLRRIAALDEVVG